MSKHQFAFTHLDEDEYDEAQYQSGSLDLQPHIDFAQPSRVADNDHNNTTTAAANGSNRLSGVDNPALTTDLDDVTNVEAGRDFTVSFERLSYSTDPQPDGSLPPPLPPPPKVENTLTIVEGQTTETPVENGGKTADTGAKVSDPHNVGESSTSSVTSPQSVNVHVGDPEGRVNVMQGAVITRPDGSRYINTRAVQPHSMAYRERKKPLRKERIRHLKIFSIISCIFFFPTGLIAVYYAFKTETEFEEGIMRGNIDRAQKFAKRSERFTILSFLMAIVVGCLVAAIIERPYYDSHHHHTGPYAG